MRTVGLLAASVICLVVSPGYADTARAWTAARASMAGEARLVIGIDLAAIQKSPVFAAYYAKALDKVDATALIEAMKAGCKVDPLAAVSGVVVAMSADQEDGAAYIALAGADRAKVSGCVQLAVQGAIDKAAAEAEQAAPADKPAAPDKPGKAIVKQDGAVTEVSDGKRAAYFGWVGRDVVVVPFHASDKAALTKWMGGKSAIAKADLGKALGKVTTTTAVWGAGESGKEVDAGVTMARAFGMVAIAKGTIAAELHAVMATPAQAQAMATLSKGQIDQIKAQPLPAELVGALAGVTVAVASDEVVFKASLPEKDAATLLGLALGATK
jgi:hypothetical protein